VAPVRFKYVAESPIPLKLVVATPVEEVITISFAVLSKSNLRLSSFPFPFPANVSPPSPSSVMVTPAFPKARLPVPAVLSVSPPVEEKVEVAVPPKYAVPKFENNVEEAFENL
jgi:hypothetical protein